MIKNKILIFVLGVLIVVRTTAVDIRDQKQKSKIVSVEIELESVPGIEIYEIEVRQPGAKKPLNFQQKDAVFVLSLDVGNYSMRTRMKTKSEIGPWTKWLSLVAPPEEVVLNPTTYKYFANKKERFIPVVLNWNFANGADKYRIWFEKINPNAPNSTENKIKKIETMDNFFTAKLPEGDYRIGVQSISKNNITSNVVYYKELIAVQQSTLPKIVLKKDDEQTFSWEKLADAEVRVELFKKAFFASDYEKLSTEIVKFTTWKIPANLRPGEYKIEFQFISENIRSGDTEIIKFVKRPEESDFAEAQK
jgi:hypothetical protein